MIFCNAALLGSTTCGRDYLQIKPQVNLSDQPSAAQIAFFYQKLAKICTFTP